MDSNELDELKNLKDLRELVEFLKANEVAEFDFEKDALKVRLKFASAVAPAAPAAFDMAQMARMMSSMGTMNAAGVMSAPHAAPAVALTAAAEAPAPEVKHHIVKSPIVGTFYEAPSPGSPPFVKIGDVVEAGQVLCIVEAMKLMNEIESDVAGEIVERIAIAGQPVEYGQSLFAIKAR